MKIKSNKRVEVKLTTKEVAKAIQYYLENERDVYFDNEAAIASICLSMVGFTIGPIGPNKKDTNKEVATFTFSAQESEEQNEEE